MIEFEQRRRQQLLDEDFYPYIQNNLDWLINQFEIQIKQIKDPFVESMVNTQYEQFCLDYTIGKPISKLFLRLEIIIEYTIKAISFVERHNLANPNDKMNISILTEYFESEILSNLLGLCILFERQDWFEIIVKAVDLDQENREKALDSLIGMKILNYPVTEEKIPRELSFRNPLYKAIHAEKPKDTLKFLDEYLRRWYDGLRKAGNVYIDSHLLQQGDSRDTCSFVGYWCFEAAAVAYLKDIDDSSLHRFIYYPKDMVEYARNNHK
ncbi:PoNe immunity protein domain-containing protein [Gilliamella bombi]|uniref:PoNe immunity protein domain-containing protein n=1 Tax=Gilliamella bombi TaxID=1908521 RepID=UPI000A151840|nr:PoNe immunity protein domain-containing protein [Gilliamella bombi]